MIPIKCVFGSLGLVVAASMPALAEGDNPVPDWAQTFARVAGGDGVISEDEYVAYKTTGSEHTKEEAVARFAELAGGDGILTYEEVEAYMDPSRPARDTGNETDAASVDTDPPETDAQQD